MTQPNFDAQIWNLASLVRFADPGTPRREGHHLPVTPEQQAKFDAWQAAYERICQQGEDEGWLTYTYDGPEVREPEGEWVYDEPEAEYEKRRQAWLDKIAPNGTFPVIWKADDL